LVFAVLLVVGSIPGVRTIPGWGRTFGLDLHHIQAFHTCASRDSPYAATGRACGDPLVPFMVYPPLLYWSFAWTRLVSLSLGRWLWAGFIALVLLGIPLAWTRPDPHAAARWPRGRVAACLFGAVLLLGFPALFAMERGNNDVLVVLAWTSAFLLFASGRPFLCGGASGLAVALKLYPLTSVVVLAAGLAVAAVTEGRRRWREAALVGAGAVIAPALVCLALFGQTREYLSRRLPAFAAQLSEVAIYSHSVPATLGPLPARWVSGGLLLVWAAVAFYRFSSRPRELFAGALAISTYFAGTSYDYDLITVYPLLVVALQAALTRARPIDWASWTVFLVGLIAVVAHRGWLADFPRAHVILQLVWLFVAAAWIAAPQHGGSARPRAAGKARLCIEAAPPPPRECPRGKSVPGIVNVDLEKLVVRATLRRVAPASEV
jgi:hypothetical protein